MDFITSDRTLQIGDLVFSTYHKGELLFKISKIERRFLTADLLKYSPYSKGQVGDEYNPLVTIESVANLSVRYDASKKFRKHVKTLDATYLIKVDPEYIKAYIKRLHELLAEFWP